MIPSGQVIPRAHDDFQKIKISPHILKWPSKKALDGPGFILCKFIGGTGRFNVGGNVMVFVEVLVGWWYYM